MPFKIFADTNVYLDVLLQRGTDWRNSEKILRLAEEGEIELFTSSSSLLNLMYVMQTYKVSREQVIMSAQGILSLTKLIDPDNTTFEIALASGFKDLEDAVQYHTAMEVDGINFFVTSNIKDFKKYAALLPVLSPKDFLEKHVTE